MAHCDLRENEQKLTANGLKHFGQFGNGNSAGLDKTLSDSVEIRIFFQLTYHNIIKINVLGNIHYF